MNILFYTPFNSRSRDTESVMEAFVKQGHSVFLLTQAEKGAYHKKCSELGVKVFAFCIQKKNPFIYFLRHAMYLRRFSNDYKIDIIYAHLETASLPAVVIQYFIKAKVFACRHVIDEAYLFGNRNFILLNKVVYRLARNIIVVSEHCRRFMIDFEKIQPKKIQLINLAYNFDLYSSPDDYEVENIKNKYPCDLLLLTACRLVGPKRPLLSLEIVKILSDRRLNVKLLVLGDGPDHQLLSEKIQQYNLQDVAFLLGFKTNIVDYISACDLFVHPSILDSSSVIIKEAGLQGKTVVACSGIGDVDEYLIHGKNAFLVSKEDTVNEMSMLIERIILDNKDLSAMGLALSESVISRFSIKTILPEYDRIHKDIKKYKE